MENVTPGQEARGNGHAPGELQAMVRALALLASQLGVPYHRPRAADAAARALRQLPPQAADDDTPLRLGALAAAAAECGMRGSFLRAPLADAVWQSRRSSPLVAISPSGEWVAFAGRGFFGARVSRPGSDLGWETMGRTALARRLGLSSPTASIDLLVVHPELPMKPMGAPAHDPHGAHHDGHGHGHPRPHERLLGLMRSELPDIASILVFSVITGILYLAVPLTVDAAVNNIAFGGQQPIFIQALVILSVALLVFLGLLAMVRAIQHYLAEVIQRRVFVRIVADLACRLPRVAADSMDRIHGPELVNRFFDVATVQKSASLLLLDGINLVLSAVIGMVVLGFYHPSLLAFDLVMLAAVAVVVFALGRNAVRTSVEESKSKYAIAGWLEELALFPHLFKSPGGAGMAVEHADTLAREYLARRRDHFRILIRQVSGLLVIQAVASSALLVVGGVLVLEGELTLGQLVASELIVNAVLASVAKLGKHLEAWYDALTAADKLGYLVDLATEREGGEAPAPGTASGRVEAHGLAFAYPGSAPLFSNASFSLGVGDRAAILAPSAGGASELLDILFGLRLPTGGHIHIDGIDARQWSLDALRSRVALCRRDEVISASVLENVRMARHDIGHEEVREALSRTGLLDDVLAMPAGLDTPLMLGGRPLSRDQRTRLVLARAIASQPRILLLDEVLDGLEPEILRELSLALFSPDAPWSLVVVATRDPDVTRRCNVFVRLAPAPGQPHPPTHE